MLHLSLILLVFLTLRVRVSGQDLFEPAVTAFDRIIPGWTNYSSAFNATHDTGAAGDYASVAAAYRPGRAGRPVQFSVVVIGDGTRAPEFHRFQFRVMVWSSLEGFIREPRIGDVANWSFAAPTSGSTTVPDARTRGGRGAYRIGFDLKDSMDAIAGVTNRVCFEPGHEYWIGFAARADTRIAGELFVPTSSDVGESDVQAGDLIAGGWRAIASAGGSTVYSGRLALGLSVELQLDLPQLFVERFGSLIELSWTTNAPEFHLESASTLNDAANPAEAWQPVSVAPEEINGRWRVAVPASSRQEWFRLRRN